MRRLIAISYVCVCVISVGSVYAQTITLNSVSATRLCAGDPVSVSFTVSGSWQQHNAFTLQLSNTSGGFDNGFTRLGSIVDSVAGSFTILTTIPVGARYSSHYRVRIIGAYPYTESADNGDDILIGEQPQHITWQPRPHSTAVAVGVPTAFDIFGLSMSRDTELVDYGSGATSSGNGVTYSTPGLKTIVVESIAAGGCSVRDSFQVYAFGCDAPVVPADAVLLSHDTEFTDNVHSYMTFWLNPGVSLILGRNVDDTIFAEAGASVTGQNGGQTDDIVYLKKGASSDPNFYGVVVYEPGASLDNENGPSIRTVECSDLSFDYSVAPPNSIMHINDGTSGVESELADIHIEVTPNPTSGVVTLQHAPLNATVTLMSLLGERIQEREVDNSSEFPVDLTQLARGTYYIRIASGGTVVTKKIVKE